MNTRLAAVAALMLSTSIVAPAHAATYTSEAAFTAANTVTSTVGFSDVVNGLTSVGSPYVKDGVTFTGPSLYTAGTSFWGSVDSLFDNTFNGHVDFSFAAADAVGFYLAGGYSDTNVDVSFYNGATLLASYSPVAGGTFTSFSFFGVDGLGDITSVRLDSAAYGGGFASVGPISFATSAAVPEPATWAMMIAGFGLVGGAMRRRQTTTVSYAA